MVTRPGQPSGTRVSDRWTCVLPDHNREPSGFARVHVQGSGSDPYTSLFVHLDGSVGVDGLKVEYRDADVVVRAVGACVRAHTRDVRKSGRGLGAIPESIEEEGVMLCRRFCGDTCRLTTVGRMTLPWNGRDRIPS